MPDMWLDCDAALSEVPVNLMPLIDSGDFVTVEDAVAYDASGMDLRWNFVTTAGAYTSTAVTPTSGGNYDWAHQGDGMYSIEIPASGGASINNDTEGFGWFTGKITGVLPFRGPVIGFRASGLNDLLIDSAFSATRGLSGTALPAAAADAAGGLPVSDAGGLDLDAKLANTNEVTTARMGALTDWIDGGRLDLILDARSSQASVDDLPTNAELATALGTADDAVLSAIATLANRLNGLVLATGTIGDTGNSTTTLHLPGLTYGNDEINNWLLVIYDDSAGEYHSRWVEDWVLATELATVATLPFTPQDDTDTYWLLPIRQDVTGGSGLDAAGVRAAIGLASANLDTQLADIPTVSEFEARSIVAANYATAANLTTAQGNITTILGQTGTTGVVVAAGSKTGYALTSGERDAISAALLDLANGVETDYTLREAMRIILSACGGESEKPSDSQRVYKSMDGTKDRVQAVIGLDGMRTSVTHDKT